MSLLLDLPAGLLPLPDRLLMPALVGSSDVRHQTAAFLWGNGFQFVPCAGKSRTDLRLFDRPHHSLQVVKQILLRVQAILEDGLQLLAVKSGEIAAHEPECRDLAAVVPHWAHTAGAF